MMSHPHIHTLARLSSNQKVFHTSVRKCLLFIFLNHFTLFIHFASWFCCSPAFHCMFSALPGLPHFNIYVWKFHYDFLYLIIFCIYYHLSLSPAQTAVWVNFFCWIIVVVLVVVQRRWGSDYSTHVEDPGASPSETEPFFKRPEHPNWTHTRWHRHCGMHTLNTQWANHRLR